MGLSEPLAEDVCRKSEEHPQIRDQGFTVLKSEGKTRFWIGFHSDDAKEEVSR